jgi:hypothetical protein
LPTAFSPSVAVTNGVAACVIMNGVLLGDPARVETDQAVDVLFFDERPGGLDAGRTTPLAVAVNERLDLFAVDAAVGVDLLAGHLVAQLCGLAVHRREPGEKVDGTERDGDPCGGSCFQYGPTVESPRRVPPGRRRLVCRVVDHDNLASHRRSREWYILLANRW